MNDQAARHLSAAEAAKALGVSSRALRLYEQKGLVRPVRTSAGWRAYGPDALARLHQILALKGLGLSLARIRELLAEDLASLNAVLELQEEALSLRQAETERALELVRKARAVLASGGSLSVDDLTTLTRETVMTERIDEEEMRRVLEPLIGRHHEPELVKALGTRVYNQAEITKAWEEVIADARAAQAKGDPTTPEAQAVARRWMALVEQFTAGDMAIAQRTAALWQEAFADPERAAKLPFGPDLMAFIHQAKLAGKDAQG
jgi:DNA-binding transcriptional MerR regulator